MTRASRLKKLSAAHDVRQARRAALEGDGGRNDLARQCYALAELLPDAERDEVLARGARGLADLIEAFWELDTAGEDPAHLARRAYRMAFHGGNA